MTSKPKARADGTCSACVGGWQCTWHQAEGVARDRKLYDTLRIVAANMRANEIGRICARYELESDEFQTREEKALQFL